MRVSREKAAENRERIVDAAARLFRDKGLDGVGVDAIMKDAGLTHGGFYGHFASKEALAAEGWPAHSAAARCGRGTSTAWASSCPTIFPSAIAPIAPTAARWRPLAPTTAARVRRCARS